jgi:hypothetical protein
MNLKQQRYSYFLRSEEVDVLDTMVELIISQFSYPKRQLNPAGGSTTFKSWWIVKSNLPMPISFDVNIVHKIG